MVIFPENPLSAEFQGGKIAVVADVLEFIHHKNWKFIQTYILAVIGRIKWLKIWNEETISASTWPQDFLYRNCIKQVW